MTINFFLEAVAHLLKEAVLLVGDGGGGLGELAPLLPQAGPHVLLLEQRVELGQRVQDLLREEEPNVAVKREKCNSVLCLCLLCRLRPFSEACCSSIRVERSHRLCVLPRYLSTQGRMGMGGTHWDMASTKQFRALG
ncbi:hypothetical protein EYF80_040578 [Liparis tanakae]|uniref:Uncharacterized protein n=1 Tax=Liparis tanakae TaxID=230148 RepID=A0A4Z2G9L2_9TELE|nr:hypothetical protein EYF80_040578 [Liparis tanakae]